MRSAFSRGIGIAAFVAGIALAAAPARAQDYHDNGPLGGTHVPGMVIVDPAPPLGTGTGPLFTPSNPGRISGSFSATVSGFTPTTQGTPINATTSGATQNLPAGTSFEIQNVGTLPALCQPGSSTSGIANGKLINPGGQWGITATGGTAITCEGVGGTTTINTIGGSGLASDIAGSSSSSGGGPATIANGADVAAGNTTDTPCATPTSSTACSIAALLKALNNTALGPAVTTPQTATFHFPGCTVGTSSASCLAASTAVNHVQIQNTSASATIACAWGVAAVLNSAASFQLGPGTPAAWGPETSGIPAGALNCISSTASTPLYLEWN